MKDYRVTIKVRNNRILKAIEDSGGLPGAKWCEANGLQYTKVNDFINMTSSPLLKNGALQADAEKLCEVLNKLPEDLWSNEQLYPLEKNFSEIALDYAQVIALLPVDEQSYLPDFSEIEQQSVKRLVDSALSTLSDYEQKVIRMRFYDEMTLDECGKQFGVTRERIREIESRALRKLRNPYKHGNLRYAL